MTNATKTIFFGLLSLMALLSSCSKDDDFEPTDPVDPGQSLAPDDLRGSVEESISMNPDQVYHLTGVLSVEEGATLTIPAGTEILADKDADGNSATGVYIVVQQGGKINIEGTASEPVIMKSATGEPGSWGGLVIAGNAVTTAGLDATAEVGGIIYGGNNPQDNSGSIKYLMISDAGAQINAESQYNGLSLYAVGSGTQIENVAVVNGADDGIEFFGGSVTATNLYFENNEDDAVDWTEGWNGSITNTYVLHSIDNFSTAIEADGANANPGIVNFTAVSTTGGTALQFKKQSGAEITGLSLSGYNTSVDITEEGRTDLSGISIEGEAADPNKDYAVAPTVDVSLFSWVQDREEVEVLPSTIDSDYTLEANGRYVINGIVSIENGAVLTIAEGVEIVARTDNNEATSIYVVVQQGAKINIEGTQEHPVRMYSTSGQAGSWGGLVIAGEGETTAGIDATAEVGGIIYGGNNSSDNSGTINFLVISDAGAQINAESQYNGLSLYAVGSGTSISNVAILNGADDGVEFFGGSASIKNLYLENNEDDAVDWTEGWNGALESVYVLHSIENFSTAIEADGINASPVITNFTAKSTTGGTALQFKKQSGAIITGLSLEGYETILDITEEGRTDLSGIQLEGEDADLNMLYDAEPTVEQDSFSWVSIEN